MKAVINHGTSLGFIVPFLNGGAERPVLACQAEVDHARRAAKSGSDGAAFEVILGDGSSKRHFEVGVRIHSSRENVLAGASTINAITCTPGGRFLMKLGARNSAGLVRTALEYGLQD